VTSRPEHTKSHHHGTGSHRAIPRAHRRRRPEPVTGRPPARYEPHLDGLFTYCLSVLCEHEAAIAALGHTLAVAERCHDRLRDPALRRPWLYALARWACLRRLADGPRTVHFPDRNPEALAERRRELGALAWPEAAGTTPEQREAIELAVRHQLAEPEIAAVLRITHDAAHALLSQAACEVERTRTALAVVDLGGCPAVARLAGDTKLLLSTALRRELVRHVDECPSCRLTAEQAGAPAWPGGTTTPDVLAVIQAPRPDAGTAMLAALHAMRTPTGRDPRTLPHFDRRGFPLDDKDRAARRAVLRQRAVTTTVVAAVVAAPAFALWAAYHHGPAEGDAQGGTPISVNGQGEGGSYAYENSGNANSFPTGGPSGTPSGGPSATGSPAPSASASPGPPGAGSGRSSARPSPGRGTTSPSPGWITVAAAPQDGDTVITVTNEGGSPVRWSASTTAAWLRLSVSSGELRPGESVAVTVTVDRSAEPSGPWSGRIVFDPSGSVITIQGQGPTPPPSTSPTPSDPGTAQPAARR
jgi:hypothetical protein